MDINFYAPDGEKKSHKHIDPITPEPLAWLATKIEAGDVQVRAKPGANPLFELTEAEVLGLRKDFALQRVFRLSIGDPDGHLRNHLRSIEGSSFAIDFGYAEFTKQQRNRLARASYTNDNEHLKNLITFPSLLRKVQDARLYHSIDAMDELIGFDDLREALEVIERLCETDRAELDRVVTQFFGADRKEEVMKVLTDQAVADRGDGPLREAIRRKFDPTHPQFKPTASCSGLDRRWRRINRLPPG